MGNSLNDYFISQSDYLNTIKNNVFSSVITNLTCVTTKSKTIIDLILSNARDSLWTLGVYSHKSATFTKISAKFLPLSSTNQPKMTTFTRFKIIKLSMAKTFPTIWNCPHSFNV